MLEKEISIDEEKKAKRRESKKRHREKTKRISITLSEEEYNLLKSRADKLNTKPTTYLKNVYNSYHKKTIVQSQDLQDDIKDLRFLIRNIANNINQIARNNNIMNSLFNGKKAITKLSELENLILDFIERKKKL
jgi:hypothetical protein